MGSKILIGKDNYLFLQETSGHDLYCHVRKHNLKLTLNNLQTRYNAYINQLLLVIFPDKEVICKDNLPNDIIIKYRPYRDLYKDYFNEKLLDGISVLEETDYYKTDTHINNKGAFKVYQNIIDYLNKLFNVRITTDKYTIIELNVVSLSELNKGIGDLTWDINKGNLEVNTTDKYYKIEPSIDFYLSIYNNNNNYCILNYNLNNCSKDWINKLIDWNCVSKNIFYKKNVHYSIKKKVLIFYDSFLLSTIKLYKDIFEEIFLAKTIFNVNLINKINPDFIIEARVERFLFA
jgi:hypothetical protein